MEAVFVELITTAPLSWFSLSAESGSAAASLPCRSLPQKKIPPAGRRYFLLVEARGDYDSAQLLRGVKADLMRVYKVNYLDSFYSSVMLSAFFT